MAGGTAIDLEADARVETATGPIVLVGNPNAGKTTLFNRLTGLRVKTANFPGTTLDIRRGPIEVAQETRELVDMPGLYSMTAVASEERIAMEAILGESKDAVRPTAIILIVDATNLVRNLYLASQILELGIPTVVALNMIDLAQKAGIQFDVESLERHLGCPVVPIVAKTGRGVDRLMESCAPVVQKGTPPKRPMLLQNYESPAHALRYDWAETVAESCMTNPEGRPGRKTEIADAILTHSVTGTAAFFAVMFAVFYLIFSLATIPMDLIDSAVAAFGSAVGTLLPAGQLESLVVDGIIAGVGGVLVFLPQICILFFCISLLEDTGYLARAACVMDRVLRRVGLPGKAFVPMLSAHACAIPAIMSARVIEDKRDRITTILVLPLLTCSARLPVYAMVTALLFPYSPGKGALVFTACYALGIVAAMSMAFIFKRTVTRGDTAPLMLELPSYKMPSLKTALLAAYDRGRTFVRKAGTVILAISIVLWWLMSYPQPDPQPAAAEAAASSKTAVAAIPAVSSGAQPTTEAGPVGPPSGEGIGTPAIGSEATEPHDVLSHSYAARLGHLIEPVIQPLGFDWKIGVGIIASFAAREVVVSALSVVYGVGEVGAEQQDKLVSRLRNATHPDGTPVFTFATCVSLLMFYVLAMQCLPTQVVTRRETGTWKWAAFQLGYMTVLAYTASLITYQSLAWAGFA